MPTPSIQTLVNSAQAVLALQNMTTIRSTLAVALANANTGTPLNPGLTNQQLIDEARQVMTLPKSDIESIIVNQLMKFLNSPPAPGGVGADKQVIWNDAGVLTGDPNFTWDGPLSLLKVTGAATITGNLTVQGVGGISIGSASFTSGRALAATSPAGSAVGIRLLQSATSDWEITNVATAGNLSITQSGANLLSLTGAGVFTFGDGAGGTRMTLNSTGLGVGVTPSAWGAAWAMLQTKGGSFGSNGTNSLYLNNNAYYDGTNWRYIISDYATRTAWLNGQHQWWNAPSGTAGNAITFTQAMTLDESGRLLVGKSASGFTTVGAEIRENGEVLQTIAASTDATYVSKVYSSTAAAYRFYVGLGGTVFATNTTISAISDARLKENVQDIDVGLGAILALKPRKFDWKAGKGKDIKGDRGFIAQEFEQVFPQLVDQWADEAPEGEAPYKSVRQDLIPVLVKAIQELTARVQTLETR